jgi:hypothetical protein
VGTSDGSVKIRIDPEQIGRWREAAAARGWSLSQLVRTAVERELAGPVVGPAPTSRSRARRVEGAPVCRNRQRHAKGVRCAYCGETP